MIKIIKTKKRSRKSTPKLLATNAKIYSNDKRTRLNRVRLSSNEADSAEKPKIILPTTAPRVYARRRKRLIINKTSNKAFGNLASLPPTKRKPGEKQ